MNWWADPRTWITVLAVLGGVLPIWGVVSGFIHARRAAGDARAKVERGRELLRSYDEEHTAMLAASDGGPAIVEGFNALQRRYEAIYAAEGLDMGTIEALGTGPMLTRAAIWSTAVESLRSDLWIVIVGVACGTASDVWGAWV